jgi:TorA maturation chaperone TorD
VTAANGTEAAERSQVYALLATAFRRPIDRGQLQRLRAPAILGAMAAAGIDLGTEFAEADPETILDRLAIDFTQLFHAPADRIIPYEGLQTAKDDRLMGGAAHAVQHFMADVGFAVVPESGEYPDHISVELAFMSELARRQADAEQSGDAGTAERAAALQRRFLAAHLGRWAAGFAARVQQTAATPFYRGMAGALEAFIAQEQAEPGQL